uniref:Fibronectin type-III domain-containing protein n=1 Tax=Ciona savignyi TaxID=51511 RepID=H2ZPZ9_CIOSA
DYVRHCAKSTCYCHSSYRHNTSIIFRDIRNQYTTGYYPRTKSPCRSRFPTGCANLTWSYHNENGGIRFKVFVFDAKLTNIEVLDTASSSVVFNVSESHLIKVKVIPYNNAGTGNSSEVLSFISPISRNLNLTVQTCAACEIKNLKMQAVSPTEIKASWDPCSLHHNLCNYRLDVMGPSSQHKIITTRNTTVVVDRLDKYAVYEIKIGTLNGQFSPPVSTRTAESVPDLAPQNITVISETSNTAI